MSKANPYLQPPQQLVWTKTADVRRRLAELQLEQHGVTSALKQGQHMRVMRHFFDPKMLGGINAWGRTVRGLREHFCNEEWGWESNDRFGQPQLIQRSLGLILVVQSGSSATGIADAQPKTKYPKGTMTELAVRQNAAGQLFGPLPGETITQLESPMQTWLLLVHNSRGSVRAEISLPNAMDEKNYVSDFAERIILPSVSGPRPRRTWSKSVMPTPPEIDVKVERRID